MRGGQELSLYVGVRVHVCVATKLKALPVQRVERGKNLHAYLQTF